MELLTTQQYNVLYDWLCTQGPYLQNLCENHLGNAHTSIEFTGRVDINAHRVLKFCHGSTGNPNSEPWLFSFFDDAGAGQDAGVAAVIEDVRRRWLPPSSGGEVVFDSGNRPLINRIRFQDMLELMQGPGGARVISIRGDSQVGKSYTSRFIFQKATSLGVQAVLVDPRSDQLTEYRPDDLVSSIANQLGIDTSSMPTGENESEQRFVKNLKDWTVGQLREKAQNVWLVFDHLDDESVTAATRSLAARFADGSHGGNIPFPKIFVLGLELIGGKDVLARDVDRDDVERLGRAEVSEFFARYLARNSAEAVAPNAVEVVVEKVFASLGAEATSEGIHAAVREVMEVLQE